MNLLDHSQVREFRARSGPLIPGTNTFAQIPPSWSPPQVQIYEDTRPGWIMEAVNTLLTRSDIYVVAVSPAIVTATPEIGRYSGEPTGVWEPLFAVTVIYQERCSAQSTEDARDAA
jgi:hypothetical protein